MLWLRGAQRGLPRAMQAIQPVAAAAGCAGGAAAARERRGQLRGRVSQEAGRAAEVEGRRPVMGRVIFLPRALPEDKLAGIQMMTDPGWDRKGRDRHGHDRTPGGLHADRPGGGALRHIRTALRRLRMAQHGDPAAGGAAAQPRMDPGRQGPVVYQYRKGGRQRCED